MDESFIKHYGKLAKCSIISPDCIDYEFSVILPCCSIQDYMELNPTHQVVIHCLIDNIKGTKLL